MRTLILFAAIATALGATPAAAQLLPGLPRVDPLATAAPLLDRTEALARQTVRQLDDLRAQRIARLVRDHPDAIALDPDGFPARAHELVLTDPSDAMLAAASARGFRLLERASMLGVGYARIAAPRGDSLSHAIRTLRRLGIRKVSADQLHFQSGTVPAAALPSARALPAQGSGAFIGMIDGGVAGGMIQRGFAAGAPRASDHGAAIASLILGQGPVRGAAPGARVMAADVYGSDPAGGSATAIAKALAWLTEAGAPVVTISLVGPQNPLLARVIAAAEQRGVLIVAAVGNDGPASPLAYPASYPGVVAVTAVDARGRVLIEAGRAAHLDYAAPGADMLAMNAAGAAVPVRGTSFAAPLVAALLARAYPRQAPAARAAALAALDRQARPRGKRYGRGLVCAACRTPPR